MQDHSAEAVYEAIGRRIVDARKQRGISQEKLAAESGIDRSHLGFIEQGRRRPTIATLLNKITKALGLSLEKVFRGL
ncbi:MAG: helix-turn-helix transcriptional regulator [Candidatus Saccharibacteria bacterium]